MFESDRGVAWRKPGFGMIIWLSSYPRSGNTLLRIMLNRVWNRCSYSTYDDTADIGADPDVSAEVGHTPLGRPWAQAYEQMKTSDETFFVKTHDIPIDAGKAIYIVRDGRSACRSFTHYLKDFAKDSDSSSASVAEVILGFTPFGSWSDHLDGWLPQTRPDTLLLRYEDLVAEPQKQIEQIADFIGQNPQHGWENSFSELNRKSPRFFRAGAANDPASALGVGETHLFWMIHRNWMGRIGYETQATESTAPPAEFSAVVMDAIMRHHREFLHPIRAIGELSASLAAARADSQQKLTELATTVESLTRQNHERGEMINQLANSLAEMTRRNADRDQAITTLTATLTAMSQHNISRDEAIAKVNSVLAEMTRMNDGRDDAIAELNKRLWFVPGKKK